MVNNLSYLKQSNNFNTFTLNKKKLEQMGRLEYSFYKYCQAEELVIVGNDIGDDKQWKQAKLIDNKSDHWLTSLFMSIKSLKLNGVVTMPCLHKLPLEILFDPQSHLESIRMLFDAYTDYSAVSDATMSHGFDEKYLCLKEEFKQQGKNIKKLKYAFYANPCDVWPKQIESVHASIQYPSINWFVCRDISLSCIRVLTCQRDTYFLRDIIEIRKNQQWNIRSNCNIETLRLIDFNVKSEPYICSHENLITFLNLQQNLFNFTLDLDLDESVGYFNTWMEAIGQILCKEYYHHLKNINLLLHFGNHINCCNIKSFFKILKRNRKMLKHQFKQLNIAVSRKYDNHHHIWTWTWNSTIDKKYLIQKEMIICRMKDEKSMSHRDEKNICNSQFDEWKQQWC